MRVSAEGILYPKDAKASLLPFSIAKLKSDKVVEIPHAAWSRCKADLDRAFSSVSGAKPSRIFVLGPLHNGPIGTQEKVYAPEDGKLCGSDWEITLSVPEALKNLVEVSDDICSEEQSLEIAAPYLSLLFPSVPVCHLLATGSCREVKNVAFIIGQDFPNSLVFISNNRETCCAGMWKEAFV